MISGNLRFFSNEKVINYIIILYIIIKIFIKNKNSFFHKKSKKKTCKHIHSITDF